MSHIKKTKITNGLFLVEIDEADLRICCGCPPDTIKFLKRAGHLDENDYYASPNAILLPDSKIQNGRLLSFVEFPVMDMLYNKNMIVNAGAQSNLPILIGLGEIIEHQSMYLCRGNYGYYNEDEIVDSGFSERVAQKIMAYKLFFAKGKIHTFNELCILKPLEHGKIEIKNGVFISRVGFDQFRVEYKGESCTVDFHIVDSVQELPFILRDSTFQFTEFSVLHSGEGNGWEIENPCMGSLLLFKGKIYAVDTGPGFIDIINHLGLDVQDLEGVFLTHNHDDHFAGLADLAKSSKKLKFYSSKLVRVAVQKKFSNLLGLEEEVFDYFFECRDLELDVWNELSGLFVKPVLSPHPVETNIFLFAPAKSKDENVYAHLADTISIGDLRQFKGEKYNGIIANAELENIKNNYLVKARVKKVDVGGGAIHGEKPDYQNDKSEKIIFSHTKHPSVRESGSERFKSSFGEQDIFIAGEAENYLKDIYFDILDSNFKGIRKSEAADLFDESKQVLLNRNETFEIKEDCVYFILNGNVIESNVSFDQRILFDRGHVLGLNEIFNHQSSIFRVNTSFINLIITKKRSFFHVVKDLPIWNKLSGKAPVIKTIARSKIFEHFLCSSVIFDLTLSSEELIFEEEKIIKEAELKDLYIFHSGNVKCYFDNQMIFNLEEGDFFGGNNLIDYLNKKIEFSVSPGSFFYKIPFNTIKEIPLVLWMIYQNNTGLEHLIKTIKKPMQEDVFEALKKSELFKVLDDESLQNVADKVHQVKASAGEVIVTEGEPSDRLFLIANGIGVVKKGLANEPEKILAYLMPGNTFGEVGILENKPRSATVSALTDVELIEIPRDLFESLLIEFPKLGIELAKLLGYYLTQTNNRLTRGNKENRLITIFKFGQTLSGEKFSRSISGKINDQTGRPTIYIHYAAKPRSSTLTSQFQIERSTDLYDVLTNWDAINFPSDSRISMVSDRLLNNYDNLIIYFENLPEENLSIIYENLSQVIIISDQKNLISALEWRENIKNQVAQRNVEFFMLVEEKTGKGSDEISYRFADKQSINKEKIGFLPTVNLIADRLERNNRIGIFIPSTIEVNKVTDTTELVNDALKFLGTTFGGATSEEAIGVWNSKDIGIVDEKVFIVHSYTTAKALKDNLNEVVEFVRKMKEKLKQESMALEINKRLTLI